MTIEISYLIIGMIAYTFGMATGWVIGKRIYELNRLKRVLRVKNPEFWDLEHYMSVDEEQEKKSGGTTRVSRSTVRK